VLQSTPLRNLRHALHLPKILSSKYAGGNRVLDALPTTERDALLTGAALESYRHRQAAVAPGTSLHYVDFPVGAMISVVVGLETGETYEVAVVGREGFVPIEPLLGRSTAQRVGFCQVPGTVVRVPVADFGRVLSRNGVLAHLAQGVLSARLFITEQLIACNGAHSLLARCARWLLTTRDRVGREEFGLTHEFLSLMLGVRRAGVSQAAAELQRLGAIRYGRAHVPSSTTASSPRSRASATRSRATPPKHRSETSRRERRRPKGRRRSAPDCTGRAGRSAL